MAVSGVTDLVGRVLTGRYRLRAPIGTGGGGRVYLADDVRLRRRVAVKVLHAALAEDDGFLRRFRAEAQLAASLHHPNIMAVYDWGEDGVPFMVLEMLAGGSVRTMLDAGVRLSPAQAAHVGHEVAAALEYAHTRGLVHRDIKPANLLFDEHGIVRVADFGLARALAEASWTEPAGAILGTARYASPEQALGSPLDGRADLYSLALVLVEAVTGRVPGLADTPIGTLAGRTQRSLVAPESLGPLGPVLERAGRMDPEERYPDAATMGRALRDAAEGLPPPAPLALVGPGDLRPDENPTQMRAESGPTVFDQDADREPEVLPETETRAPRRRLAPFLVAAVILAALAVAAFALLQPAPERIPTPQLVGRTLDQAVAAAEDAGLDVEVGEEVEALEPAGTVLAQDPPAGSFLADDGGLRLVVSRGPPAVAVPGVVGLPVGDARARLEGAGFLVDAEQRDFSENVPVDVVLAQTPAPEEQVAGGSRVELVVSRGPAPRTIPSLSGRTFDEAAAELGAVGLGAARADEFSDDVDAGRVIGTTPAAGESVARGTEVTVVVSRGPELVAVPNVVNLGIDAATAALESAGLGFDVDTSNFAPGALVATQSVPAGTEVERGTVVTIAF